MTSSPTILFFILLLSLFISSCPADSSARCPTKMIKGYEKCLNLPTLNATLFYSHNPTNSTLSVVFVAVPPNPYGWISWGINPTNQGMVGAQVFVGFKDKTKVMVLKTFRLESYALIIPGKLRFETWDTKAEESDGYMSIYATIKVPNNATVVKHTWQIGANVTNDDEIQPHDGKPENLHSKGDLILVEDKRSCTWAKNAYEITNILAWGIFNLLGMFSARYLKMCPISDHAWLLPHVVCHFAAYVIGFINAVIGIFLGSELEGLEGIKFKRHRNIGITLVVLYTIQIVSFFRRPKKDSKYRLYWIILHHGLGYIIVGIGILHVHAVHKILKTEEKWTRFLIGAQLVLDITLAPLEGTKWIVCWKTRSNRKSGAEM